MSRSDTLIGLNDRSKKFLQKNTLKDIYDIYVNNVLKKSYEKEKSVTGLYKYEGVFSPLDTYLPGYYLKDGSIVYEKVQVEIWSSGPVTFTCLVDKDGKVLKDLIWTDEEMDMYI